MNDIEWNLRLESYWNGIPAGVKSPIFLILYFEREFWHRELKGGPSEKSNEKVSAVLAEKREGSATALGHAKIYGSKSQFGSLGEKITERTFQDPLRGFPYKNWKKWHFCPGIIILSTPISKTKLVPYSSPPNFQTELIKYQVKVGFVDMTRSNAQIGLPQMWS